MANKKVFFKIVVPNYNNFIYIKKCLDSIKNQTFKDYVCIVVDDLSTDRSFEIAQIYERRDPEHFVAIKLDKKGYAGAARNKGIDYLIDSEYTWFIDSDDWVHDDWVFEYVHENIMKLHTMPDLIQCAMEKLTITTSSIQTASADAIEISKEGAWPCTHIIKSANPARFVEDRAKNNDVIWFCRALDHIDNNKIISLDKPCVTYNISSVTSCQHSKLKYSAKCNSSLHRLVSDFELEHPKTDMSRMFKDFELNKIKIAMSGFKTPLDISDVIKHSFIISINEERLNLTYKIFDKTMGYRPELMKGCTKFKSNIKNCQTSHYNCVLEAKKRNYPFVMIFEDDVYPCENIKEKFQEYLDCMPKEAKLIMFGWLRDYNKQQKFNAIYNKITSIISGAHAYMIFKDGYDFYLDFFNKNPDKPADDFIFKTFPDGFILDNPLFIQYNVSKSMHKHFGYAAVKDSQTPPKGFLPVEMVIN